MSNEAYLSEGPNTSEVSAENTKVENQSEKTFTRYRSLILSECGFKITTTENHLKRLQNLRKELNYLKDTEWMYDSLDKRIGN